MKKFLLTLTAAALISSPALAENKAPIEATDANPTYAESTEMEGWTLAYAAFVSIDGVNAPTLNGRTNKVGSITSPTLTGGLDQISFKYANTFSETKGVSLKIEIKQGDAVVKTQELTKDNADVTKGTIYEFTSEPFNVQGDFVMVITNLHPSNSSSSNKDRVSIWNLTWTNPGESFLENPELSFASETAQANLGEEFTAPVLSNPHGVAPILWTSSNENVATVEDGNVTILSAGTTEIKAAFEGDETYNPGSAKYTLTVVDPNALEATFDFVNENYGLTRLSGSTTEYIAEGTTAVNGKVILTFHEEGNNHSRLWTNGLRLYNQGKITVSLEQGYKISEITVDPATNLNCTLNSDGTYTIARTSTSSNTEIKTINVKYSVAPEYTIAILEVPNEDGGAVSIVRQNEQNGYDIYASEESFGSFRMLYDDPLLNPFELDFYTLTADDENLTWESIDGSSQYEFSGEVGIYPFTVMFKPELIGHQNLYKFSTLYDNRIIIHPDVENHFSFTDLEWKEASVEIMVEGEKMHRLHHPNFEGKNPNGDYTYYYMVNTHAQNQIRREAEAGTEDEWNEYDHETGIILPQGTHTVIFNAAKNGVMAPTPKLVEVNTDNLRTGVTTLEAENGKAAYFDMMGRRVAEPTEGIFVKVQNGKTSKVIK